MRHLNRDECTSPCSTTLFVFGFPLSLSNESLTRGRNHSYAVFRNQEVCSVKSGEKREEKKKPRDTRAMCQLIRRRVCDTRAGGKRKE
jgi:hypothetical protein